MIRLRPDAVQAGYDAGQTIAEAEWVQLVIEELYYVL